MESITYPLELQEFSWLMVNHSRTTNTSGSYPFMPSSLVQDGQATKTEYLGSFLNLAFQDLALGGLSLLVLRNLYKDANLQVSGKTIVSERNFKVFDIILTNLLKTIIGIALLAVSLPIALPVTFIFWVMSTAVKATYAYKFGSSASKAQGMDGLWGLETTESRPFILVCLRLSGKPDARKIIHHINSKILDVKDESGNYKYRKFRQTFSKLYGYYVWQDAGSFCTEDHIRIIDLQEYHREQATGTFIDKVSSESAEESVEVADALLNKFLSEEGTTALPGDRPPWEVMLLTREDGSYNVIIKVHHAIGDGISLMRLCVETLVDVPLDTLAVAQKKQNPIFRAALGIWSALLLPLGLLQLVANFDRNSMHGCHLSGKKVIATSRRIPLSILKGTKIAAGTTVNDVLMSCLSASLSKHFSRRSEKVDQVTTLVPISFHDLSAPLKLTNIFSAATVKLNVSQDYTSEERLKSTKNTLDSVKRDPTLLGVFKMLTAVSEVLPAPVAELLLSGGGISLAASNVPGPQQEISVWGDKVKNLHFWVPNRAPVGVGFSFVSYLGYVNIGLNVDSSIVESDEEAQQLLDGIEAEAYYLHKKYVQSN